MSNPYKEETNEAKFNLRLPRSLKDEIQKLAAEEGLSMNSAIVQRLVWSMKFTDSFSQICKS